MTACTFGIGGAALETKRLILRPWRADDLSDFYAYARADGVGEMAGWRHHNSIETSRAVLSDFMKNDNVFAMALKDSGKVIGSVGVHAPSMTSEKYAGLPGWEIGYAMSRDYWGRGLMPEAVRAVVDHIFSSTDAQLLYCCHFIQNAQSRRVIEKTGFCYWRDGHFWAAQLGQSFPTREYVLTRESWALGQPPRAD